MNTKLENVKQPKLTQPQTGVDNRAMNLAASWYVAMRSKALGNKPKAIELFGQPLVAWRDQKGYPVIMELHCSHLGASLAIGKVVNNCIQCPFHHWRYDHSGQCVSIPEIDHIPPRARQATYVTVERYGYIWVWYGSQTPLFSLPEFPAAEDERHNYMPFRFADNTKTTVLRVIENTFDYQHFASLHGLKASSPIQLTLLDDQYSEPHSELPIQKEAWFGALIQWSTVSYSNMGPLGPVLQALGLNGKTFTLLVDGWSSGQKITFFVDGEEKFKLLVGITPVAEKNTTQQTLVMVKKSGNFLLDIFNYVLFNLQNRIAALEDVPLFNTIKADIGKAYVKHDVAVLKFRNFYQTWVDKVE